jgi:hypothetical protein
MSFLSVLGTIGKDALTVAAKLGPVFPGPIGFGVGAVASVVLAELHGGTGAAKRIEVVSAVTPAAPPSAQRDIAIGKVIDGLVAALNGLAELFASVKP